MEIKKIELCNTAKEAERIKRDFLNVTVRERVKRNLECHISPISKKELIEIILDKEFPISNSEIQKIIPKHKKF